MPDEPGPSLTPGTPSLPTGDSPAGGTPSDLPAPNPPAPQGNPPAGDNPPAPQIEPWHVETWGEDLARDNAGLLEPYKDKAAFLKAFRDNKTAARAKTEGMVKLPGPDAAPEDVQAFRRAIGVPESVDAYRESIPSDLPDGVTLDKEQIDAFLGFAHESGMTPSQVEALVRYDVERTTAAMQAQQEAQERAAREAQEAEITTLTKYYGEDHLSKIDQARDFVRQLGRDPDKVVRTAEDVLTIDHLRKMVGEDSIPRGDARMYSDPDREADAIISDPKHPSHERYVNGDPATVEKVRALVIEARKRKGG